MHPAGPVSTGNNAFHHSDSRQGFFLRLLDFGRHFGSSAARRRPVTRGAPAIVVAAVAQRGGRRVRRRLGRVGRGGGHGRHPVGGRLPRGSLGGGVLAVN